MTLSIILSYHTPKSKRTHPELSCPECNVIIIGFDALQANRVSHLGYSRQTTPTLDKLAKEGVSFAKNYAVASWTVPSFMSYFTSLYQPEHRLVNKFSVFTKDKKEISNLKKLSPEVMTMAEAFKLVGYITGGFTGDAGVNSVFGYNSGFDIYTDEQIFGSFSRSNKHAMEWLDKNPGKRFFMFFHGYDAHGQFSELEKNYVSPFSERPEYDKKFINAEKQRDLREEGLVKGVLNADPEEIRSWNNWYDGKILDADARVDKFLTELDKRGLLENTLIVAISDHGTEVFEHGRVDHGFGLYNEMIRVPMVIKWPNKKFGRIIDTQVRSIDLLPTVFEIVGITPNAKWRNQIKGKSLLPVIAGENETDRPVFSETDYRDFTHKRSYISPDGWKLIVTMESDKKELYDLNADPTEKNDLSLAQPERVKKMTEIVYSHIKETGQKIEGPWPIGCLPVYNDQCK